MLPGHRPNGLRLRTHRVRFWCDHVDQVFEEHIGLSQRRLESIIRSSAVAVNATVVPCNVVDHVVLDDRQSSLHGARGGDASGNLVTQQCISGIHQE